MHYTVKIYEHGMAFFGDPSWGHVASTVAHTLESKGISELGVLAPHRLIAALARLEDRAPALVVCWTTMSRDAWAEELCAVQMSTARPFDAWATYLAAWDSVCSKDERGHDWKAHTLQIDGEVVAGAVCDSRCGAACRPEKCRWDDLPWERDPGSVDDLVGE